MELYKYRNYKKFLNNYIENLPKKGREQYLKISEFLGVHPTMVSQVLKGPKNFSEEQAYKVCEYLGLNLSETDYFMNLLHLEKAGTMALEDFYVRKLDILKSKALKVSSRIKASKGLTEKDSSIFYSDWKYSAIRLLTSLEQLNTPEEIAERTKLPLRDVKKVLDFLLQVGLVKSEDKSLDIGVTKTHLKAGSPFVKAHHTNWRLKAIEKSSSLSSEELQFTGPLTISKKDFETIKIKILDLIEEIGEIVEDSPAEQLSCLNIDFINIT